VQQDLPQRTTATYSAWVVQCEMQKGPPPQKLCEMEQVAQVQGRNVPFSRIAIAHPTKGQPVRLIAQVPVNVSTTAPVRIKIGNSDTILTAPLSRCVPVGCTADFDIKDDSLNKLRSASDAGQLSFADASGTEITVPILFSGFAQAFDALTKE
jgi:invasion protein IalB